MSEQLISAISFGNGPTTAIQAPSGGVPAITGGKVNPIIGKALPILTTPRHKPALEEIIKQLNIENLAIGRDLRFQVDLDRGYAVIQVLDRDTGELIRQIPPEKISPQIGTNGTLEMRLYDEMV